MKLTAKVELGIKAVEALRSKVGPTRTEDLAVEINAQAPFLEQVVRELRLANILVVKRGPGGGYALNPFYGPLTAYQVATALGRDLTVSFTEAPLSKLQSSIIDAYKSVTL